jgi:DNA modification methylase
MTELKIETVAISSLTLDPANARKHDGRNLQAIQNSLLKFGQRKPICVTPDSIVVAGNGTLEAAKSLGWTEIVIARTPVGWSWEQIRAFALADNRTAELAEWDDKVLADQLLELDANGWELEELGFANLEPAIAQAKDEEPLTFDDVPTKTKIGDLWQLENHRILCADSTDANNTARLFKNKEAELCFTSPPYADQREYNGGKNLSTEHIAKFIEVTKAKYFVINLGIMTKNQAINCYWDDYIKSAEKSGLKLLSWNIWSRQGFAGFTINQIKGMFAIEHEWIFVFGKEPKILNKTIKNKSHSDGEVKDVSVRLNNGDRRIDTITTNGFRQLGTIYSGGVERKPVGNHPATFPIEFPITYIEAMTNRKEIVYDPFGGSGTTLMACEQLDRTSYIMELDPKYCDVIIKRWESYTGKTAELVED